MKNLMFADTERITHHLMLNAYFNPDLGLFHGQMGTVLAMSEYSKYSNNEVSNYYTKRYYTIWLQK